MIETGLIFDIFFRHEDLIRNFGSYETLSTQSAVDPKGLIHNLPLVEDILEIAPSCEIHPQPLRNALVRLLTQKPMLNTGRFNGGVWSHQRSERVCVLLSHIRRLARQGCNSKCVQMLTALEYKKLADTLEKVDLKGSQGEPLPKGEEEEEEHKGEPSKKKLKHNTSDVSLDSQGFPLELKTPEAQKKSCSAKPPGPPRLLNKRVGQNNALEEAKHDPSFKQALGMVPGKAAEGPKRRPAAAMKRPAASEAIAQGDPDRRPWLKITKTSAKNPERSYLCGTKGKGGKCKLIVEVSKKRSNRYGLIIGKIKEALEKKHLTKEEAVQMREELCSK